MAQIAPPGQKFSPTFVKITQGSKVSFPKSTRLKFETVERFGTSEVLNRVVQFFFG